MIWRMLSFFRFLGPFVPLWTQWSALSRMGLGHVEDYKCDDGVAFVLYSVICCMIYNSKGIQIQVWCSQLKLNDSLLVDKEYHLTTAHRPTIEYGFLLNINISR
jgi:hypothetical protein